MKDKELKLEEIEASHTVGGAGAGRVEEKAGKAKKILFAFLGVYKSTRTGTGIRRSTSRRPDSASFDVLIRSASSFKSYRSAVRRQGRPSYRSCTMQGA